MGIIEINANKWKKEVLESQKPVVVEFWHEQCYWCRQLDPIYEELSEEFGGKLKFAKINILQSDENFEIAEKYGIMGTPTLIFFCKGKAVASTVGFRPKEQLKHIISEILKNVEECAQKISRVEE